jgi:cytochrome c oxidase subunit 4
MRGTSSFAFALLGVIALSMLTFGLSYVHLGAGSVALAMIIAAVKAGIIAMFFMNLRQQGTGERAAVAVGVILLLVLIGFVAADVATRTQLTASPF